MFRRRHSLRDTGVELLMKNNKSLFLAFSDVREREDCHSVISRYINVDAFFVCFFNPFKKKSSRGGPCAEQRLLAKHDGKMVERRDFQF